MTTALLALFMGYHMGEVLAWLYKRLFGTHDRPPVVKVPRFLLLHKKGAKDVSDSKKSKEGKQEDQEMVDMQHESGGDLEENCDPKSHFEESDETAKVEQEDSREGEDEEATEEDEEGDEDNRDASKVEQEDSREEEDEKDEEGDEEDNDATADEDTEEATHKKGKKSKKEKKRKRKEKKEKETLCSAVVAGEGEGGEGEEWQLHHEREQVSPPFIPRSFKLLSLYCVINLVIMFAVYALLISLAVAKRDGLRLYVALMASPPATILRHFLTKRNLGRHANAFPLYTLCTCLPPKVLILVPKLSTS